MPSSIDPFPITVVAQALCSLTVLASDLDAVGVMALEMNPSDPTTAGGSLLELDDAVVLNGLAVLESGDDLTGEFSERNALVFVKAKAGGSATIVHQSTEAGLDSKYKFRVLDSSEDLVVRDDQLVPVVYDVDLGCWCVYSTREPVQQRIIAGPGSLVLGTQLNSTYYGPVAQVTEMAVTMNSSVPALNSATVQLVINGVDATNGAVSVPALTGAGAKLTASPTGAELHDGDVFGVRVSAASGLLLGGLSATTSLKLSRR